MFFGGGPELQAKTVIPSTSVQTVKPDSNYDGLSQVTVNAASLQEKTVSPSTSAQTVKPDSGQYGLSQVTVNAASLQAKTVSPSTSAQTVKPDSGKYGLSQVTVSKMNLQEKTVTPSTAAQSVTPDSGYHGLSKVTVNGIKTIIPDVTYELKLRTRGHSGNGDGWANGDSTLTIPTGPYNYIVAVTGDIRGATVGWVSSNSSFIVDMVVPEGYGFSNDRSGTITLGIR